MATIILPRSLVSLFPGADRRASVPAATVAEAIDRLDALWPGMRDRVCDAGPSIREHINVFVDGERATLDTPLTAGSVVHVIPAVAGG
jgi:molybdopterin converting factor small subunit